MPKKNPANLNALQLKTLTLFQALAELEDCARPGQNPDHKEVFRLPHAHGDHFHLGRYVVRGQDATGLNNQAVWVALQRKGLIEAEYPTRLEITKEGLSYETGMKEQILHSSGH